MGEEGLFLAPCPGVAVVAPVPQFTVIFPQKNFERPCGRKQVHLLHSLAGHAQPLVVCTHVMCHHGRPVQLFLVGHRYMVQRGPTAHR